MIEQPERLSYIPPFTDGTINTDKYRSVAAVGYDLRNDLPIWQRVIYIALAAAIFFVPIYTVQFGLAAAEAVWLLLTVAVLRGMPSPGFTTQ